MISEPAAGTHRHAGIAGTHQAQITKSNPIKYISILRYQMSHNVYLKVKLDYQNTKP